jgi:hypothetical protein
MIFDCTSFHIFNAKFYSIICYGLRILFYVLQLPHFYKLCMNVIMNERAHKGFMICYTNIDELTRLFEMLHIHSCS